MVISLSTPVGRAGQLALAHEAIEAHEGVMGHRRVYIH